MTAAQKTSAAMAAMLGLALVESAFAALSDRSSGLAAYSLLILLIYLLSLKYSGRLFYQP